MPKFFSCTYSSIDCWPLASRDEEMLKIYLIEKPQDKSPLWQQVDLRSQTWLVSDLRSKFEVQQRLLSDSDGFADDSVLRASEFWRRLLRRQNPDFHLLQEDLAQNFLREIIQTQDEYLEFEDLPQLKIQSLTSYLEFMQWLAPVYLHPQGMEILKDFFNANEQSSQKILPWVLQTQKLFHIFIQKKYLLPAWVPSYLFSSGLRQDIWQRDLWVDLGASLQQSEIDLFKELSRSVNVNLILPDSPVLSQQHLFLLAPMKRLQQEYSHQLIRLPSVEEKIKKNSTFRFSGPVAQAKHVVAQTRIWLEEGIQANDIAIVAPNIEAEWPLLEPHFLREGIAVQKESSFRLHEVPIVAQFMSALRLSQGQIEFHDLELAAFKSDLNMRFERFSAYFQNVLDISEVSQEKFFTAFLQNKSSQSKENISLFDFMIESSFLWPLTTDWTYYEKIWQDLLLQTPFAITLKRSTWLSLIESRLAKIEMRISSSDLNGIFLLRLSEAECKVFKKRIFLSLTESSFEKNMNPLIRSRDLNRLGWDFGFFLDHPEHHILNFDLDWARLNESEEDQLVFPATSIANQPESPHPIWLSAGGQHQVNLPELTVWDQEQAEVKDLTEKMQYDLGQLQIPSLNIESPQSLSPSRVEKFRSCAFQYAAENHFYLLDLPERDMDLDPRHRGQLQHKVFEKIVLASNYLKPSENQFYHKDWSEAEILKIIDEARQELGLQFREGLFWQIDEKRVLKITQRFIQFEKEWHQEFANVEIEYAEKKFHFYYNTETKQFLKSRPSAKHIEIRGAIDRVDKVKTVSSNYRIVLDYKPTWDQKRAYSSWFDQNFIQLAFYAWALDQNFIDEDQVDKNQLSAKSESLNPVGAIATYTYQPLRRDRGFMPIEMQGLIANKVTSKSLTLEDKKSLYSELEKILVDNIELIISGYMRPFPLGAENGDFKICEQCHWSQVCRAPHLNL